MSLSNEPTSEPGFEDPALRDACRRAWGGERAAAGLRERIARALRDESRPADEPQRAAAVERRWRPGSLPGLAAAAVVLLAVGGLTAYYAGLLPWPGSPSTPLPASPAASLIPDTLAVQLANVHYFCSANDHHPLTPSEDFQQTATRLRKELGRPVLAFGPRHLSESGNWRFRGGAVCPVGGHRAGHLVFVRGQAAVSVFSLPARACPRLPADGQCEVPGKGCNIAAFRQGDGFFCVVGSSKDGSLTCDQVRALRDKLRTNVVAARPEGPAVAHGPPCRP